MFRRTPVLLLVLALLATVTMLPTAAALDRRIAVYCDSLDATVPRCGYSDTGRDGGCEDVTRFVGVCLDADGQVLVGIILYGMDPPCSHPDNCSGGHVGGEVDGCHTGIQVTEETPRDDRVRQLQLPNTVLKDLFRNCPV